MERISRQEVSFAPGEDTYGLRVFREEWKDSQTGRAAIYWKYGLPDSVQVLPLTANGRVIAIEEWNAGVGATYLHLPGETLEPEECPATSETVLRAARRALIEEVGAESAEIRYLSAILENSGKSDRLIHFAVAFDCKIVLPPEEGIVLRKFSLGEFWHTMMAYWRKDPAGRHGGGNTLKLIALAYDELGLLTVKEG